MLGYITWDVSPEIFSIGPLTVRWYGTLFALGFLAGLYIVRNMFRAEGAPEIWLDKIFMYIIIGAIVGARLGHVFFYDWDYYSEHLNEIPQVWLGGLASHGGAIGVITALWIFSIRTSKRSVLWILDKVAVPTALAGLFIRTGNLMNSEILGKVTDVPWAFKFVRVDDLPRHPVQIYEGLTYLALFFILYWVYWKTDKRKKLGYLFGLFMALLWGARFFLEFFKADLGGLEESVDGAISTGQLLSIPFVLIGLYFIFRPQTAKNTVKPF